MAIVEYRREGRTREELCGVSARGHRRRRRRRRKVYSKLTQ